jgi:hypothetical protein
MEKKIIYAVAIGGIGYLIYKNFDKIKSLIKGGGGSETGSAEEQSTSATTPPTTTTKSNTNTSNTTTQANPYKQKVETLQALLKVGIDGGAGKQTNGALENLYSPTPMTFPAEVAFQANYPLLRKNGKGVVTANNVDFYINALQTKTTPTQLYYKNQGSFVKDMKGKLPKFSPFPTFGK